MKTNIVLHSPDRNLFGVTIRQETKTGFLNLSDLQEAYTRARVLNGWGDRGDTSQILNSKANMERIYYLLKERDIIKQDFYGFMEEVEQKGIVRVLKELNSYRTTGRGANRTVLCDPYIWVLVAMEFNPQLYAKVVLWLTDRLILNRIEAGNMYKGLTKAISKFPNTDYIGVAKALNHIVFGKHETGIRNFANEKELKELEDVEKFFSTLIDMDFIKTQDELKKELQRYYLKKHNKELKELN